MPILTALIALAALSLASCAKKNQAEAKAVRIGISKIVAHPALDQTELGIQDELKARGIQAEFDLQNANGDVNTAAQIANKFKSDGVDAVVFQIDQVTHFYTIRTAKVRFLYSSDPAINSDNI
jgi:putative ABC transport system substrate-binding protein